MTGCYKSDYLKAQAALNQSNNDLADVRRQLRTELKVHRSTRAAAESLRKELQEEKELRAKLEQELVEHKTVSGKLRTELDGSRKTLQELKDLAAESSKARLVLREVIETLERKIQAQERMLADARNAELVLNSLMNVAKHLGDSGVTVRIDELPDGRRKITVVIPESVLFDQSQWALSAQGKTALKDHADMLKKVLEADKYAAFEVIGHTDSKPIESWIRGRDGQRLTENYFLGLERARSVAQQLTTLGIPSENMRISSRSFGNPVCSDVPPTEECHKKNRRVEYSVTLSIRVLRRLG